MFWKYRFDNLYKQITFAYNNKPEDWLNAKMIGARRLEQWGQRYAYYEQPSERQPATEGVLVGDIFDMVLSVPVFTEKALAVVKDLLGDSVELLPLILIENPHQPVTLYALNVIDFIPEDWIDFEHSESDWGTVSNIRNAVFHEQFLTSKHIFRTRRILKNRRFLSHIYLSDEFKQRIVTHGFKGILFKERGGLFD